MTFTTENLEEQYKKDLMLFKGIRVNEAKALIVQIGRFWNAAKALQPGNELDLRVRTADSSDGAGVEREG